MLGSTAAAMQAGPYAPSGNLTLILPLAKPVPSPRGKGIGDTEVGAAWAIGLRLVVWRDPACGATSLPFPLPSGEGTAAPLARQGYVAPWNPTKLQPRHPPLPRGAGRAGESPTYTVATTRALCRIQNSSESASASQLASMMSVEQPTVRQISSPSDDSISTRVDAPVPFAPSRMRTL